MSKKINKNIIWPVVFTILLIIVIALQKQGTSLSSSEKKLAFSGKKFNQLQINHLGNTLTLKFKDGKWISEDQNDINTKKINSLANVLMSIEIQSAVASASVSTLNAELDKKGYLVNILLDTKTIYNAMFGVDNSRNYIKTSTGKLYYIKFKGYSNLLISDLLITDPMQWQEKMLINLSNDEITSIVVEYPDKTGEGFKLTNKEFNIDLETSSGEKIKNTIPEAVNDYLNFFTGIQYELLDTSVYKPSKFLFRLAINTTGKKIIQIDGFELTNVQTLESNPNKFSGIVNNSIMVQLNYSDFDPILVDPDYFQKK